MSFQPSVKCTECEKSYLMKENAGSFTFPDGWVSVTPNVLIYGALRDGHADPHIREAIRAKIQTVHFCIECSGAEKHIVPPPLNGQQPRKIATNEPVESIEASEPAEEVPQRREKALKSRPSLYMGSS